MSLQKILNRNGPRHEPWAVPCVIKYCLLISVMLLLKVLHLACSLRLVKIASEPIITMTSYAINI